MLTLHLSSPEGGWSRCNLHSLTCIRRFFYIRTEKLNGELINKLWEVNRRYFDLSAAKKAEMPQLDWNTQHLLGYAPPHNMHAQFSVPLLACCKAKGLVRPDGGFLCFVCSYEVNTDPGEASRDGK